jgi:hypothetical protein
VEIRDHYLWSTRVIYEFNWSFDLELVVLHKIFLTFNKFLVHAWSHCGGLHEELNFVLVYCESQTHFVMPRGAKMSLALNEPIQDLVLRSNLHTGS